MRMFAILFTLFLVFQAQADPAADCASDPASCATAPEDPCTTAAKLTADDAMRLVQQDVNDCDTNKSQAQDCCNNPANCQAASTGGMGGGSDMSQLMKMMMTVSAATLMAQSSPDQMSSMSQICSMFGGMNTAGAAVNNNTAQACTAQKKSCSDFCDGQFSYWTSVASCHEAKQDVRDAINQKKKFLATATTTCNALNATAIRAQAANQASAGNGSMQNVCNQLAQQQQNQQLTPVTAPNVPDCTNPMLANTNVCLVCNSSGVDSTACQQAITDSAGAKVGFQASASLGNGNNSFNSGDPGSVAQNAQFGDGNQNNPMANNGASPFGGAGSSGMMPMSAQQAGGPNGPGRPGQGPGYNTAVLQGERGATGIGGLGGSLAPEGTGTFPGYGNGSQMARLDLKNYLPGRQLYAGRKVAGVGSANPDINPRTTDLFKRISDRFKVICSLNRLIDCTPAPMPNKTGI